MPCGSRSSTACSSRATVASRGTSGRSAASFSRSMSASHALFSVAASAPGRPGSPAMACRSPSSAAGVAATASAAALASVSPSTRRRNPPARRCATCSIVRISRPCWPLRAASSRRAAAAAPPATIRVRFIGRLLAGWAAGLCRCEGMMSRRGWSNVRALPRPRRASGRGGRPPCGPSRQAAAARPRARALPPCPPR